MKIFDLSTIVSALVGAFVASLGAEYVKSLARRGQSTLSRREEDLKEILCSISTLTTIGEAFWSKSAKELGVENTLHVARIVGQQHYLSITIAKLFSGETKKDCDVLLAKLIGALSGGDFSDPEREADYQCLKSVHLYALSLKSTCRQSHQKLKRPWLH